MLEKPNLPDEKLITCLRERYGIITNSVEFLPLGYDSYASVYRVDANGGNSYFLKAKQNAVQEQSLVVPYYLKKQGIGQVVAPLQTQTGVLWEKIDDFTLILCPLVEGEIAATVGMSDAKWQEFGTVLKNIHSTRLPNELAAKLPHESFVPKWGKGVKQLERRVENGEAKPDLFQQKLAAFWQQKRDEINHIVNRAETLGQLLQNRESEIVVCHADIHTFNIMLNPAGDLFIIDWDETLLALKERDLMFVVDASVGGISVSPEQEALFLEGYGSAEIDWVALAYYRYEWVVQEFGEFGALVFSRDDVGAETKEEAVHQFIGLFDSGNVIEAAYKAEEKLPTRLKSIWA